MDATTVAIDLAKDIFEVALANNAGRIIERWCCPVQNPSTIRSDSNDVAVGASERDLWATENSVSWDCELMTGLRKIRELHPTASLDCR